MSRIRIWILFLAASCSACTVPARDVPAPSENEQHKTIYLVNQGWHAGIVLRRADIPDSNWPILGDFPKAHYLEVGWGDMDFYLTQDPHWGLTLKAALWPTASALHIAGFNGSVPAYFPYSEIIGIELPGASHADAARLMQTLPHAQPAPAYGACTRSAAIAAATRLQLPRKLLYALRHIPTIRDDVHERRANDCAVCASLDHGRRLISC